MPYTIARKWFRIKEATCCRKTRSLKDIEVFIRTSYY
jgi:hypothetical protein